MATHPAVKAAAVKVAFDTSVVVPLLSAWHKEYDLSVNAWTSCRKAGQTPLLVSHVLLEAFAVLTRLPGFQVGPDVARKAIRQLSAHAELVDVTPQDAFDSQQLLEHRSMGGAVIYDAVIAVAAARAGATALVTLNLRDFLRIAPPGLAIVDPRELRSHQ